MQRSDYSRITLVVILLVVVYYVFRILQPFLSALVWAAILATVFYPFFGRMSRALGRRRLASALTCGILTALIILPVILLLILLAGESIEAYNSLEARIKAEEVARLDFLRDTAPYQWLRAKMQALSLPEPDLREAAIRGVRLVSRFLVGHSVGVFSGFTRFAFGFFVMLLSLYYLFLHGAEILRELRGLSPLPPEHEQKIIDKFKEISAAVLEGSLLTALIQGAAGGLVFLIFGLPSPLLWGTVMAFLSLVPVVGTALVWGPVVLYYVFTGAVGKGLALLVICGAVVGSVDNLVKPLLVGRKSEIHTLWVFLGILGGVGVFGFLGFILGPLMVSVLFTLIEIYKLEFRKELAPKNIP
jgi:predicted PurR-regulated permease PerM